MKSGSQGAIAPFDWKPSGRSPQPYWNTATTTP